MAAIKSRSAVVVEKKAPAKKAIALPVKKTVAAPVTKSAALPVKKAVTTSVKKTVTAPEKKAVTALVSVEKVVATPAKKMTREVDEEAHIESVNRHVRLQTAEGRKRVQREKLLEMRKRKWSDDSR